MKLLCKNQEVYDAFMKVCDKHPEQFGLLRPKISVITPDEMFGLLDGTLLHSECAMVDMNHLAVLEHTVSALAESPQGDCSRDIKVVGIGKDRDTDYPFDTLLGRFPHHPNSGGLLRTLKYLASIESSSNKSIAFLDIEDNVGPKALKLTKDGIVDRWSDMHTGSGRSISDGVKVPECSIACHHGFNSGFSKNTAPHVGDNGPGANYRNESVTTPKGNSYPRPKRKW